MRFRPRNSPRSRALLGLCAALGASAMLLAEPSFGAGKGHRSPKQKSHAPKSAVSVAAMAKATGSVPIEHGVPAGPAQPAAATDPASRSPSPSPAAKTEEDKEGVKTYHFGAVEVEGRLRSPELIYFLRRVRAEFSAEALGHRSFLRELGETEREGAFR